MSVDINQLGVTSYAYPSQPPQSTYQSTVPPNIAITVGSPLLNPATAAADAIAAKNDDPNSKYPFYRDPRVIFGTKVLAQDLLLLFTLGTASIFHQGGDNLRFRFELDPWSLFYIIPTIHAVIYAAVILLSYPKRSKWFYPPFGSTTVVPSRGCGQAARLASPIIVCVLSFVWVWTYLAFGIIALTADWVPEDAWKVQLVVWSTICGFILDIVLGVWVVVVESSAMGNQSAYYFPFTQPSATNFTITTTTTGPAPVSAGSVGPVIVSGPGAYQSGQYYSQQYQHAQQGQQGPHMQYSQQFQSQSHLPLPPQQQQQQPLPLQSQPYSSHASMQSQYQPQYQQQQPYVQPQPQPQPQSAMYKPEDSTSYPVDPVSPSSRGKDLDDAPPSYY